MSYAKSPLIIALDVDSAEEALSLIENEGLLQPAV